ncbi:hypothetical protein BJV82DRAFT_618304 [Fennellomyces sp. T-0311]|nr:hypothetical protein BJV82DRAFT_618304 [Fennellomyces sp. T-0311]
MTLPERVYIIGGTGNIGTAAVKELLKHGVSVTVYARSPTKAQGLFGNNDKLTIVEGDLNDLKPFEGSIDGHTRLLLIVNDIPNIAKFKIAVAQRAYAAGVKQIVDISTILSGMSWRTSIVASNHRAAEEGIIAIPDRGAFVTLRPGRFMSNHLWQEIHTIKNMNTIMDSAQPDRIQHWISPNDIALVAANIFRDPVEKHADAVYDLIGELVTLEERAQILTNALGRTITYTKISVEQKYQGMIEHGLPHYLAYEFLSDPPVPDKITPGLSILLGRQPETLVQWLEQNKAPLL